MIGYPFLQNKNPCTFKDFEGDIINIVPINKKAEKFLSAMKGDNNAVDSKQQWRKRI